MRVVCHLDNFDAAADVFGYTVGRLAIRIEDDDLFRFLFGSGKAGLQQQRKVVRIDHGADQRLVLEQGLAGVEQYRPLAGRGG